MLEEDVYGDNSGSKVVREHAYGTKLSPKQLRNDASSHMSTENYHSNAALPPVKEYSTEAKNLEVARHGQAEGSDK